MNLLNNFGIFIVLLLGLSSCANVASLTGGPKDDKPPIPDSVKSTQNFQTRFKPSKIKLVFDEWITLKNPEQILISPPTSNNPVIRQRGKYVSVEIDKNDTLRENTTYNLNFGNSITDFTEGNPLKNYSFIFSTGDKIDSLSFHGKVINSVDNKPEKDILVMLYDRYEDSIVVKSKPYYFAYTNETGLFRINNIKEGKYKVFALKDANSNYLFDNISEKIAYIDSLFHISSDTMKQDLILSLFQPDLPLQIKDKNIAAYGKIVLMYSRKPDSVRIINSSVKILAKESIKDSILIWYDVPESVDSVQMILKSESMTDTLVLKTRKKVDTPINLISKSEKGSKIINPDKPLLIEFNQPVETADSSLIEITDSNKIRHVFNIEKDANNKRIIKIRGNWDETKKYIFSALPGAFKGLHKQINDSIIINFKTYKRSDFGNITCSFDSLDSNVDYIVQLKQKENIIEERSIKNLIRADMKFPGLEPGLYSLDIIIDENKNGRWNAGDYFAKKQAEKIIKFQMNELKKNWDQTQKISLKK